MDDEKHQNLSINQYQDIVDRAHKEIEAVRKVYYWFSGLITVLLVTGIGAGAYIMGKNVSDIRTNVQSEVDLMKRGAAQEFALQSSALKSRLETGVGDVETRVKSRIDEEFNRDNIQGLVKEKAQERIDKVADPIIELKIDKKISPVIAAANKTLKAVEVDAAKMHDTVTQLELFNEFILTNTAAQNDDRAAFEQLRKWATDKSYPLSSRAQQSVAAIMDRFDVSFLTVEGPPIPWGTGVDPSKLRMIDLEAKYELVGSRQSRSDIAYYIEQRGDISKKDKLGFFVKMLIKEKSMAAYATLLKLFERESGQKFNHFDSKPVVEWWNRNRDTIK
jgi:hypothetical protein